MAWTSEPAGAAMFKKIADGMVGLVVYINRSAACF